MKRCGPTTAATAVVRERAEQNPSRMTSLKHNPVRVTFQLLDYYTKRIHYFEPLLHVSEG